MRSKADFDTAKSLIEGSEKQGEVWTVAGVAEEVGVSIGHLHRLFKKYANTTPKDFVSASKMPCVRRKSSSVSDQIPAVPIIDDSSIEPGHLARVPSQHQNYSSQDHEAFSQALLAEDFWLGAQGFHSSNLSLPITNDQVRVPSNTASDDFTCHDLLDSSTGLAQLEDALSLLDWNALYMPTDGLSPPEAMNYMDSFLSILGEEGNES
jgi:AraC-like DNA-binding protein